MTITELRAPASARLRWLALAVLMLPVLLVAIDNTVLAFAVPAISEALRPTGEQLLWIIDIYPLVLAGLLVPMGSLGDRFGRRRLLLIGATGFAAISAVAAFVPTAGALIAGFRQSVGTDIDDPRFIELVGELSLASPLFRRVRARQAA